MALPVAFWESRPLMPSDSATGTLNSMPKRDSAPTHDEVMMYGGYEYFGSCFFRVRVNSSMPSWTIACSFGADRNLTPPRSKFVRNDVFTEAPFS